MRTMANNIEKFCEHFFSDADRPYEVWILHSIKERRECRAFPPGQQEMRARVPARARVLIATKDLCDSYEELL